MFNFKFYLLPLLILSIGLSGCTKLNKDVSKTLSIVIEPAFKEQVLDAVKYATSKITLWNLKLKYYLLILIKDLQKFRNSVHRSCLEKVLTYILLTVPPMELRRWTNLFLKILIRQCKVVYSPHWINIWKKILIGKKENYNPSFLLPRSISGKTIYSSSFLPL